MYYLVYERDPFVRADICEALAAEFPGKPVVECDTLESLEQGFAAYSDRLQQVCVAFAISAEDSEQELDWLSRMAPTGRLVILADEKPADFPGSCDTVYLFKPFSTHGLIAAIRDGLSDQPASPT
ncbi:hypothetical protein A8B82_06080 [Sulfitobacter sp. EhC04]|uniref:hypothetical protein n=1 Tax=Sulfitobacter sp. EhC04 TaxID=1849168 RepID=UPI0007F43861|nr:hypothetical protein [Sulfitobacter sp. EhC04]OAN67781.1 hypothetical protein A8B82_06080 [Sulfitobacter sp. EhC04]